MTKQLFFSLLYLALFFCVDPHNALFYSLPLFSLISFMWTLLPTPTLCSCLPYLHFSAPRLHLLVAFSSFLFTLQLFKAIASKLLHTGDATRQSVDLLLCVPELLRCVAGKSGSRLPRSYVFHLLCGLGDRQGQGT